MAPGALRRDLHIRVRTVIYDLLYDEEHRRALARRPTSKAALVEEAVDVLLGGGLSEEARRVLEQEECRRREQGQAVSRSALIEEAVQARFGVPAPDPTPRSGAQ